MAVTQEDQAYNRIKVAISKGYIKKGSKLTEVSLANTLNMSRATVKNAIKRLVFEGLAEHVPNRGVSVVNPTLEEINQTFQVRGHLEQMALYQAADNLCPDDFRTLSALIKEEENLFKAREMKGYHEINNAFHLKIAEKSENKVLVHYVKELLQKTTIYLVLADPFYQLLECKHFSPSEHRQILRFLQEKKIEEAGQAMKHHLESTMHGIEEDQLLPSDYLTV
jgi:DNA-binding GntR family transcriptional regulator